MATPASQSRRRGSKWWYRPAARQLLVIAILSVWALASTGCATLPPGERDPRDHFERFNRTMYRFDTSLDHAVLRPVARGYVKITPVSVRRDISNFLSNLTYTKTIVNDILQARFRDFGSDVARLRRLQGAVWILDPILC